MDDKFWCELDGGFNGVSSTFNGYLRLALQAFVDGEVVGNPNLEGVPTQEIVDRIFNSFAYFAKAKDYPANMHHYIDLCRKQEKNNDE